MKAAYQSMNMIFFIRNAFYYPNFKYFSGL